jgi:flavodoxin I
MKVLIIYDSFFGNTEQVAQMIGQTLGTPEEVAVQKVGDVKYEQLTGLDLLIIGSPTRGFRPSEATTNFLKGMPSIQGVRTAAFDTRIDVMDIPNVLLRTGARLFGYAAAPIAKILTEKGGKQSVPPEGFYVKASEGPLKEGELDRVAEWAKSILGAQ